MASGTVTGQGPVFWLLPCPVWGLGTSMVPGNVGNAFFLLFVPSPEHCMIPGTAVAVIIVSGLWFEGSINSPKLILRHRTGVYSATIRYSRASQQEVLGETLPSGGKSPGVCAQLTPTQCHQDTWLGGAAGCSCLGLCPARVSCSWKWNNPTADGWWMVSTRDQQKLLPCPTSARRPSPRQWGCGKGWLPQMRSSGKTMTCFSPGDTVNTQEKLNLLRFWKLKVTSDATISSIVHKRSHIEGAPWWLFQSPPLPSPSLGIIQGHPSCRWCLEVGAGHEAGWAQHPSCAE